MVTLCLALTAECRCIVPAGILYSCIPRKESLTHTRIYSLMHAHICTHTQTWIQKTTQHHAVCSTIYKQFCEAYLCLRSMFPLSSQLTHKCETCELDSTRYSHASSVPLIFNNLLTNANNDYFEYDMFAKWYVYSFFLCQ